MRKHIDATLGIFDKQRGLNQQSLVFQEAKLVVPTLFPLYDNIVNFQVNLLKIINFLDHSGVMVSCLQPKEIELFKASNNPFIKCYNHDETSYLVFGAKNIETVDPLMTILLGQNSIYQNFIEALSDLTEIYQLSQTLPSLHISETENLSAKSQHLIAMYNKAIKDVQETSQYVDPATSPEIIEQHKHAIKELQAKALQVQRNYQISKNTSDEDNLGSYLEQASNFHQQVLDIMIEGSPLRNKIYLNDNPYIKDLF